MSPVQTLHDFALNLLNDPTALAAFGTDPQQALAAAGLGDVSAADVHEVIPLVLDYVPVDSLGSVGGLGQLGELPALGTDAPGIQGAIDQLTALTQGLGLPATGALPGVGDLPGLGSLPVSDLPAIGELGAHLPGVSAVPSVSDLSTTAAGVTALAGDPSGALAYAADLAHGLDANALGQLGTDALGQTEANAGNIAYGETSAASNLVSGETSTVADHAQGTVGELAGAGTHVTDSAFGSLGSAVSHVGDFNGVLNNVSNLDVQHVTGNLTHTVTGELGNVTHVAEHATSGVVSHVADTAGATGTVSEVHDVVSNVAGDTGHDLLGALHVGDVTHDLHLGL